MDNVKLPDFGAANILVVGDVMLDQYWSGECQRISPEAPVPVVKVSEQNQTAGGAGNALSGKTKLVRFWNPCLLIMILAVICNARVNLRLLTNCVSWGAPNNCYVAISKVIFQKYTMSSWFKSLLSI